MNQNFLYIINLWLKKLNYKVEGFDLWFSSHPDFPSIKSISDTLQHYKIYSISAKIDLDTLLKFDKPFLSYVNMQNQVQLVFTEIINKGKGIKIIYEKGGYQTLTINEFESIWQEIVIVIDENKKNMPFVNYYFWIFPLTLLVFLYLTNVKCTFYNLSFFVFSLIGLLTSIFLIRKEYGLDNGVIEKFCTINKKSNCDNVINSKGAKLFKKLSLSTISFLYFLCVVFFQLFEKNNEYVLYPLSIIAFPSVFYSIYYQWRVSKTWCPLCLFVVVVLSVLFLISIFNFDAISNFDFIIIFKFLLYSTIFILLYVQVNPLIRRIPKYKYLETKNLTFRRDYNLFLPYYIQNNPKNTSTSNIIKIEEVKNPILKLTAITNPLCESCIKAHNVYMNIIKDYPQIELSFLFFVPIEDRLDPRMIIAEKLIQLYKEDNADFQKAMKEWYKNRDYISWIQKWGVNNDKTITKILREQHFWCMENDLSYTPALLINGTVFPKNYEVSDIQYFIEHIIEYEKNSQLQRL